MGMSFRSSSSSSSFRSGPTTEPEFNFGEHYIGTFACIFVLVVFLMVLMGHFAFKKSMKPSLMIQTPCAGYVILKPMYEAGVEIQFQDPYGEIQRDRAKDWLLNEGFIGFSAQEIKLEPEVSQYLESIKISS